ncbi:hypothetical protein T484DRAFT_1877316 [Baffinella frigidus]|nr:hypothetical protein T484DRAFT_1877316 [Cryptophyta sp. CCMP2293]
MQTSIFKGTWYSPTNVVWGFDPTTGDWRELPALKSSRVGAEAAFLRGKVYISGGFDFDVMPSTDAFELREHSFIIRNPPSENPLLASARKHNSPPGTLGKDSGLGGGTFRRENIALQSYKRLSGWIPLGRMMVSRTKFALVSLSGCLWVMGGTDRDGGTLKSVEVFDPRVGKWSGTAAPMLSSRSGCAAAVLDGRIYVAGGVDEDGLATDMVESYDPTLDEWRQEQPMREPRECLGFVAHDGGEGEQGEALRTMDRYSPQTDSWDAEWSMPDKVGTVSDFAALVLQRDGGRVFGEQGYEGVLALATAQDEAVNATDDDDDDSNHAKEEQAEWEQMATQLGGKEKVGSGNRDEDYSDENTAVEVSAAAVPFLDDRERAVLEKQKKAAKNKRQGEEDDRMTQELLKEMQEIADREGLSLEGESLVGAERRAVHKAPRKGRVSRD